MVEPAVRAPGVERCVGASGASRVEGGGSTLRGPRRAAAGTLGFDRATGCASSSSPKLSSPESAHTLKQCSAPNSWSVAIAAETQSHF